LPKETIHVGDSLISDYYGAKNAGLQAILIDRDDKIKDNNNITKINSLREIIGFLE
jgi:FMN phosphatase YigB (HAD superfamily)